MPLKTEHFSISRNYSRSRTGVNNVDSKFYTNIICGDPKRGGYGGQRENEIQDEVTNHV